MTRSTGDRSEPGGLAFEPLTPTAFLDRSALVWGDRDAVVDGQARFTYSRFRDHCRRLAGALRGYGVEPGDRVAVLAPNTHLLLAAHYAVPYAGAVLVALNHRLAPAELATILAHSGARVLLLDRRFAERSAALADRAPQVGVIVDEAGGDLEAAVSTGDPLQVPVRDERDLLALNYTSGTTGQPKGVMYHHRGAYLQALAMAYHTDLDSRSVMLWTLPMFHCNGWSFPWAATAAGATHLCLPELSAGAIWRHIRQDGVTHLNAAPTVLTMLAAHPAADEGPAPATVRVGTGGAPPSPTLLARLQALRLDVTHLYGLTETYGPAVVCEWQPAWDGRDDAARLIARQGVGNVVSQRVRVVDDRGEDVPADRTTIGEVALRGNNVMLGYYRDPEATAAAAPDGWFRTGDLGVRHPDGYLELKDRAKDIIISGGENIASVEVEQALLTHPAVVECAVVAAPDAHWGEIPVAHVTLAEGATASPDELIDHVRSRIARFKAPRRVLLVEELPKTATGKIQKHLLRAEHRGDGG